MKKNLLSAILGLTIVLFTVSCSKSDTTPAPAITPPAGTTWVGLTTNLGPSRYFSLTFNNGGTLTVKANDPATPDIANGTWALVADSVKATYTYVVSATTYSLAGKYSSSATVIVGTLGPGNNTTGAGTFSVTKQ